MHMRRRTAPHTSLSGSLLIRRHRLTCTPIPATTILFAIPTMAGDSILARWSDFMAVSDSGEVVLAEASAARAIFARRFRFALLRRPEKPRVHSIRSV